MTEAESGPGRSPQPVRERHALFVVVVGTVGLQALFMISGIFTARILGVEGRGIIALVFAIGLMASQLTFGGSLPNAIAKNLAERRVAARDGLRSIFRRRFAFVLVPCVGAAVLLLILQRADWGAETYALAAAAALLALQHITFRILTGSLQGEIGHLGRMAMVGVLPQLLFVIGLSVVWVSGWDASPVGVLALYVVATFLGLAVGFAALARPTHRREDELDEAELWSMTRDSYVSSVRPIDGLGLDRVLIGGLLGVIPLGLYAAATAVSSLCRIVGSAFSVIVLPQVATHTDPAEQRVVIRRWLMLAAALMVVVVVAIELIVAPVIIIAFGREFEDAIEVARWLVVADGLLGFRLVLIAVLQGEGRSGTASWIELMLTPVVIFAIVLAALDDNVTAIGIAMVGLGVLSSLALGGAVARGGRRRDEDQPVSPPSTTMT